MIEAYLPMCYFIVSIYSYVGRELENLINNIISDNKTELIKGNLRSVASEFSFLLYPSSHLMVLIQPRNIAG